MYEYKFVKVPLKTGFLKIKPRTDYHAIISEHTQQGWRFVQIFAPVVSFHSNSSYFEIIFEREKQSDAA